MTLGRRVRRGWKRELRCVARGTSAGRPESRRHPRGKAALPNARVAPEAGNLYRGWPRAARAEILGAKAWKDDGGVEGGNGSIVEMLVGAMFGEAWEKSSPIAAGRVR